MPRILPSNAILVPPEAKQVFKGIIFDVYQWQQKLFDGSYATFERLKRPDTVLAICIKDDKLILIRDEQPGRRGATRLPGGRVDEGEDWDDAVKRECSEELGFGFAHWRLIAVAQGHTKIEWFVAVYLAFDCIDEHAPHTDAGERIELKPMTFSEAKDYLTHDKDPLNDFIRALFSGVDSLEALKALPTFTGKEI